MPGTNLTYAEATSRGALLRLQSYAVELDLSGAGDTFRSTTEIRFVAQDPGASTFADLVAPTIHEIMLNGRRLDPAEVYADGRIALTALAADNELRVVADCAYMNTGEGLHRSVDPVDGNTYLYTHFEVPEARRVFATFEQPDLKASFQFTVTAPAGWVVRSNCAPPEPELVGDDAARWTFPATPRISTYITAIVAGPYHVVADSYTSPAGQVVPMAVGCRASLAASLDAAEVLEVTKQGFDYFIDMFDQPYPFDRYDQFFVPEYNIGAMENVGCVTINDRLVFTSRVTDASRQRRAETILHELAHMWFGDLVTMRWWDDMWLKESFATYLSVRCQADATRWRGAWTAFAIDDKTRGLRQDQLPSTHPIVAEIRDLEDIQLNFDGITYSKGAAVLKQLVAWVGDEPFIAGIRSYFQRHAWGCTTLDDLLAVLEESSGRDLGQWAREWLQTTGPNTLRPEFSLHPDGTFASFTVIQEPPAGQATLRSHRVAIGLYGPTPAGLVRQHRVELDVTGERTDVSELVGVARPDLLLLNDDDLTFAKVRFDPESLSTVLSSVARLVDPLPRALCWTAAWDMVRQGELAARDYLEMVLAGIGRETEASIVHLVHPTVLTALERFVDPAHRVSAAAGVAAAARRFAVEAEPGGDLQLAWVRLLAEVAAEDDDLTFVRGLRDGTIIVDGLTVDTDLRWRLLAALLRSGRAGDEAIDAELARERTTTSEQYAAGARAARPTREAKESAWVSLVERGDLPNGTQLSVIGGSLSPIGVGFVQVGQEELLEPYAERYFEALTDMWANRTMEIGRKLVSGLYPTYAVDPVTIKRTDDYLAQTDVPSALRRLLVEGRDDVVSALRARAADRDRAGRAVGGPTTT